MRRLSLHGEVGAGRGAERLSRCPSANNGDCVCVLYYRAGIDCLFVLDFRHTEALYPCYGQCFVYPGVLFGELRVR